MQKYTVFDIESDGLLDTVTKIHCLSYSIYNNGKIVESKTLTEAFFDLTGIRVIHDIIGEGDVVEKLQTQMPKVRLKELFSSTKTENLKLLNLKIIINE